MDLLASDRASVENVLSGEALSPSAFDPVLRPLVNAVNDVARCVALETVLVTVAAPVVQSVLQRRSLRFGANGRFSKEDEEDLAASVMVRLVRRLSVDLITHPILNLQDYVAGVTKHEIDDHFRRRYSSNADALDPDAAEVAEAVAGECDPLRRLELTDSAAAAWREIRALPSQQRAAVLLNLRDVRGSSALSYFIIAGVATLADLARAVDLSLSELAELWRELPLPDLIIAARLGITRQRVINLRQAARKRLARRIGERGALE